MPALNGRFGASVVLTPLKMQCEHGFVARIIVFPKNSKHLNSTKIV